MGNTLTERYTDKINEVLNKDYDHEIPDKPRSVEFNKLFKKMLKEMFPDCEIIATKGTWCEASGFIKNADGICVFYNTNDYRWEHWDERILIRLAKNEKDYTGFGNNFSDLDELEDSVRFLMSRKIKF